MTVHGVDVASYQATDFPTSGLAFAFVKATEGTGYVNPLHAAQVAHARATGLLVGHYHYGKGGSVAAELAHFLGTIAPQLTAGDLLAFDWEETAVSCAEKDDWIRSAQARQPAHRVLLYCNRDFWLNRDTTSFCGDGLWIADPSSSAGHPRVQHAWTVHQYSSSGGIDHNVAAFADRAALAAWAAKTTSSQEDDDMPTAQDVWDADVIPASRPPFANDDYYKADGKTPNNTTWRPAYTLQTITEAGRETLDLVKAMGPDVAALKTQVAALTATVQTLASKVGSGEDVQSIVTAVDNAIKDAVIRVAVTDGTASPAS